MVKTGTIRIGISGWTYAPWRGVFYPKELAQKKEVTFPSWRRASTMAPMTWSPTLRTDRSPNLTSSPTAVNSATELGSLPISLDAMEVQIFVAA